MENKNTNNEIFFNVFFQLFFLMGGIILSLAGLTLISLKLFGYPFLFEGVMSLFVGLITIFLTKIYSTFLTVLESFTAILDKVKDKKIETNNNRFYHPQDFLKNFENDGVHTFSLNSAMSPEKLEEIKEKFPHLSDLINNFTNMQSTQTNSKKLSELTLEELKQRLNKAVAKEDYEKASLIKAEISKRK